MSPKPRHLTHIVPHERLRVQAQYEGCNCLTNKMQYCECSALQTSFSSSSRTRIQSSFGLEGVGHSLVGELD